MIGKLAPKALSGLLALALGITLCPAASLAYAVEGDGQQSNSTDNTASTSSTDRVNEDVMLDASAGSSDESSGSTAESSSSDKGSQDVPADSSAVSSSDTTSRYTGSGSGQTSADVSLAGDATVGTIEYSGLAYTISEDDPGKVEVTGLASTKPTGDVVIPAQISTGGKTYVVAAIQVPGLPDGSNPYVQRAYEDGSAAEGVTRITLPATVESIDVAFFQLFPNAERIDVSPENNTYSAYNGNLYNADMTSLVLVPEGAVGVAVLPDSLVAVPAYVFSQCNKLSAISFSGSTGNYDFAIKNNCLYTSDLTTLLAAPVGLGASASIAAECTTIAEGAFFGNAALDTIVVGGVVEGIASAGDNALDADGQPLMGGSAVDGSTLPAFDGATVENATVVINVSAEADGDEAAAMIERAKAAWVAYGFTNFKEPAAPGTEIVPEEGSGFAFTLLPDYTLSVRWAGSTEPPAAIDIPDYGIIDGVQYTVSAIAQDGFSNYTSLITVDIPQTVTTIGASAFELCTSLQTVHFDSVVSIGAKAFANTALLSLVLPTTVQSIGDNAFSNMKETAIVALGSIADNSPIALGAAAGLSVYVPYGTEDSWDAGIPTLGNHIYPYGVKLADEPLELEVGQTASITDSGYIEAPGDIETNYAYKANPVSINTDDGTIEAKAAGSTYINVSLELTIDQVAVKGNVSNVVKLQPVSVNGDEESNIVSVPQTISLAADTMNATISANPETIEADVPDVIDEGDIVGETSADPVASFFGMVLASDTDEDGTPDVAPEWTYSLTADNHGYIVTLKNKDTASGTVKVPSYIGDTPVLELSSNCFQFANKIENLIIEENVTTIPNNAIRNMDNLVAVELPSTVTSIGMGDNAMGFGGACPKLNEVIVNPNNETYSSIDGILYNKDGSSMLHYPIGRTDPYYIIPESVTSFGLRSLYGAAYVEHLVFPDSMKNIPGDTFGVDLTGLKSITFGSNMTAIDGNNAFARSSNVIDIYVKGSISDFSGLNYVPNNLNRASTVHLLSDQSAEHQQHWRNAGFNNIDLENGAGSIWNYTENSDIAGGSYTIELKDKTLAGYVTIPGSYNGKPVTRLSDQCVRYANNITTLAISDNIKVIPNNAIRDMAELALVKIPSTVTDIGMGDNAMGFGGVCPKLNEVIVETESAYYSSIDGILYNKDGSSMLHYPIGRTDPYYIIPESVTSFGLRSLYGASYVEHLVFPDTMTNIPGDTFGVDLTGLKSITFGSRIAALDAVNLFARSSNVIDIYVKGTITDFSGLNFAPSNLNRASTVHLLADQSELHQQYWRDAGFWNIDLENGAGSIWRYTPNDDIEGGSYTIALIDKTISGYVTVPGSYNGKPVTRMSATCCQYANDITTLDISENIVGIPEDAVNSMESLKNIKVPKSATSIDMGSNHAGFGGYCYVLERIDVDADNPTYASQDGIVYNKNIDTLLRYPCGKKDATYDMPDTITSLGQRAIYGSYYLKHLIVSDGLPGLENSTNFADLLVLESVTFGPNFSYLDNGESGSLFPRTRNTIDIYVYGEFTNINIAGDNITIPAPTNPTMNRASIVHLLGVPTVDHVKVWQSAGFRFIDAPGLNYVVTFDSVNGSSVPSQNVGYDMKTGHITEYATLPNPAPTRAGQLFDGWWAEPTYMTPWDFGSMKITDNTTLYAKWVPEEGACYYTVNYYIQNLGATGAANAGNSTLHSTRQYYGAATQKVRPVTIGIPGFTAQTTGSENLEIKADNTASWTYYYSRNKYTLTVDAGSGATIGGSQTQVSTGVEYGANVANPGTPTKLGYSFDGWYETYGSQTFKWDFSLSPTMTAYDLTLTARWTPIVYTIALSANGKTLLSGSASSPADKFTVDEGALEGSAAAYALPVKEDFKATGYTLDTWKTATGSKSYSPGEEASIRDLVSAGAVGAGNTITFQAQWTENTYTIRFENGHDHATSEPKADITGIRYASASAALGEIPYANYGYAASGWGVSDGTSGAFKADGTTAYTGKQLIDAGADEGDDYTTSDKTITLYANWAPSTYTISYESYRMSGADKVDAKGTVLVNTPPSVDVPASASQTLTIEDVRSENKPTITGDITSPYTGYSFAQWKGGITSVAYNGPSAQSGAATIDENAFKRLFGVASGNTTTTSATLTACWDVKEYTFVFDKAEGGFIDGSGVTANQTLTAAYNAELRLPVSPDEVRYAKEGYALTKWMTSDGGATAAGEVATIGANGGFTNKGKAQRMVNVWELLAMDGISIGGTDDAPEVTLYAKWEGLNGIAFTVQYYYERPGEAGGSAQGGTFVEGDSMTGTAKAGETIVLADNPGGIDYLVASKKHTIEGGSSHDYAIVEGSYDNGESSAVTSASEVQMDGDPANNVVKVYYRLQLAVTYKAGTEGQGADQASAAKTGWGEPLPAQPSITEIGSAADGIRAKDQYAHEFSHWMKDADAETKVSTADLASAKIYDDVVYTANWMPIEYTLNYAYKDGETHKTGVDLPSAVSSAFEYADILSGSDAGSYTISESGVVSRGYTFAGWLNSDNASDAASYASGTALTAGDTGTFLKLFPNAPAENGREATLYADIYENEYSLGFYKFSDVSGERFTVDGVGASPMTVGSKVVMPRQMASIDEVADGAVITGIEGIEDPGASFAATKIAGYALSKWSPDAVYSDTAALVPGTEYEISSILDKAYGDGQDAPITIADGKASATIDLYAAWTAVYSAALPTDSASARISISATEKSGMSEQAVEIQNRGPHDVWVEAASEVTKGSFNNVNLWDAIVRENGDKVSPETLPEAGFTFTWSGRTFKMDGGVMEPVMLSAASAASGATSMSDRLLFSIPATGYKVNPSIDGYTVDPETGALLVDRGQIARIIWTISATRADGSAYQDTSTKVYPAMP